MEDSASIKKYYIYTLTDPIDMGIKYVGKTKNLKNRLSRHMSQYSLKESWTKKNKWLLYLKNNNLKPLIEILDEGHIDNIDDLEIYWISQLKAWGYKLKNETKGGKGCEYWTGKKLSKEHILKTKMGNPLRKVICEYEIISNKFLNEYISIGEASKNTGHKRDTIINSCKGKSDSLKHEVYWRYKENYFPYIKRNLTQSEESKKKSKMNNPLRKVICQYEIGTDKLIKEYASSHDVDKDYPNSRTHITKCCKGIKNYNSVVGYYWRFRGEYFPLTSNQTSSIKVIQYDLNKNIIKEYETVGECKKLGYDTSKIDKSFNENIIYKNSYWKKIKK